MVSGWLKPFIVKQLCLLVLNSNHYTNYPNDPDQWLHSLVIWSNNMHMTWNKKVRMAIKDKHLHLWSVCL